LQGEALSLAGEKSKGNGENLPSNHRAPIPKRLFAYTQTTVRLYAN